MTATTYADTATLSEGQLRTLFAQGDGPERVWCGWRLTLALGAGATLPVSSTAREHPEAGVRRNLLIVVAGLGEWDLVAELSTHDGDETVRGTGLRLLLQRSHHDDRVAVEAIIEAGGDYVDEVTASFVPELMRLGWSYDPVRYAAHPRGDVRAKFVRSMLREGSAMDRALVAKWYATARATEGWELAECLHGLTRRVGWADAYAMTAVATGMPFPARTVERLTSALVRANDALTIASLVADTAPVTQRVVALVTATWKGPVPRELQIALAKHASTWLQERELDEDVAVVLHSFDIVRECDVEGWFERQPDGRWYDDDWECWNGVSTGEAIRYSRTRAAAIAERALEIATGIRIDSFPGDLGDLAAEAVGRLPQSASELSARWKSFGDDRELAQAADELWRACARLAKALQSRV